MVVEMVNLSTSGPLAKSLSTFTVLACNWSSAAGIRFRYGGNDAITIIMLFGVAPYCLLLQEVAIDANNRNRTQEVVQRNSIDSAVRYPVAVTNNNCSTMNHEP